MRCPGCGLYHPSQYERCISCGVGFSDGDSNSDAGAVRGSDLETSLETAPSDVATASAEQPQPPKRRSKELKHKSSAGIPTSMGILLAIAILLVAAGATTFFLTRAPQDERLLVKGRQELSRGQYAFAVDTLKKSIALRPEDSRAYLLLARAYVGINDVDKAWEAISHAQQLGKGVVAEPELASELANYYMKKKNYEKAIGLLRPLAKQNIKGKKAELADLDAAYGDELLADGELDKSLACWEEVRNLRAGSRFGETEARLATIYEKFAIKLQGEKKDDEALSYLSKLTNLAKNPKHYVAMADIYERNDKLELAIEVLRKALQMSNSERLQHRLAGLLARRGKELLDKGDNTVGYAYLQQARSIDPSSAVPDVTLRDVSVGIDAGTGLPRIYGEVWNPGTDSISSLSVTADLWDTASQRSLWSKETKVVDEFVRPLGSRQSQPFRFLAGVPAKLDGTVEFRMYVDGSLYKSYILDRKQMSSRPVPTQAQSPPPAPAPAPAPAPSRFAQPPQLAPQPGTRYGAAGGAPVPASRVAPSGQLPEQRTLQDLDF